MIACACGCGREVVQSGRGRPARFFSSSCRARTHRDEQKAFQWARPLAETLQRIDRDELCWVLGTLPESALRSIAEACRNRSQAI